MAEVSVIIPVYNPGDSLIEAVNSVLSQKEQIAEILLINDGSDDEYLPVIEKAEKLNSLIKALDLKENGGVSRARNYGLKHAIGPYIYFLDQDDQLCDGWLKSATLFLEQHPQSLLVVGDVEIMQAKGCSNEKRISRLIALRKNTYNHLSIEDQAYILIFCPMINTFLSRKEAFDNHKFEEDLSYGEDMYLWLQLHNKGLQFQCLSTKAGKVRIDCKDKYSYDVKAKFHKKILATGIINSAQALTYQSLRYSLFRVANKKLPVYSDLIRIVKSPLISCRYLWMNFRALFFN